MCTSADASACWHLRNPPTKVPENRTHKNANKNPALHKQNSRHKQTYWLKGCSYRLQKRNLSICENGPPIHLANATLYSLQPNLLEIKRFTMYPRPPMRCTTPKTQSTLQNEPARFLAADIMGLFSTFAEKSKFWNRTGLLRGETPCNGAGACHMLSLRTEGSSMLLRLLGHLTRHLTLSSSSGMAGALAARRCC